LLQSAGVLLHEIERPKLVYPGDGPMAAYFYRHQDPVIPTYWFTDEIAPSIERAIALYGSRYTAPSLKRGAPTSVETKP
jgi:hypothetical protein